MASPCPICLMPITGPANISGSSAMNVTEIIGAPCGHVFHSCCLQRWFTTNRTHECPVCRDDTRRKSLRTLFLGSSDAPLVTEPRRGSKCLMPNPQASNAPPTLKPKRPRTNFTEEMQSRILEFYHNHNRNPKKAERVAFSKKLGASDLSVRRRLAQMRKADEEAQGFRRQWTPFDPQESSEETSDDEDWV